MNGNINGTINSTLHSSVNRHGVLLHEWIAGSVALLSCLLLALVLPGREITDLDRLINRAISNVLDLTLLQVLSGLGVALVVVLLSRWPRFRDHLSVKDPKDIFALLLRATLPLVLMIVFHQTIPIWQRISGVPEADALLIALDEKLFFGVNPVLWMERLIHPLLTEYMWAVYLSWFIAFQGTIYLLALLRKGSQWMDMALATVITLTVGYLGYIAVPAVGPVHAMTAQFTVDLTGSPISSVTNGVVNAFGVWRDAFPSIHTAISMLLMLYAWRYLPRWRVAYTILCVSIIVSTVYLRWHYVMDVLAGIAVAGLGAWLAPRLMSWWECAHQSVTLGDGVR